MQSMQSLVVQPRAAPAREGSGSLRSARGFQAGWASGSSNGAAIAVALPAMALRTASRRRAARRRAGVPHGRAAAGFAVAPPRQRAARRGPKGGFAKEAKLRSWLKQLGCVGMDLIELGQKSGVWLKPELSGEQEDAVKEGRIVLEVPRQAWIQADPTSSSDADIEELLAAELLKERAKGPSSSFAPYVDFLWRRDLSHHPMFWTQEELSWLSACDGAQTAVLAMQEQAERRRAKLCERLDISVPEEDVLFALCLVESRAIQTDGVCGALVPLLDHLRNDSTAGPALIVGDEGVDGGPMVGVALHDLEPGTELRNCFEPASNLELFTQYGEVQIKDTSTDEDAVPEANAFNYVQLPIKVPAEQWRASSDSLKKVKLDILRRRAGFDFSREADGSAPFMRLPMDAMVTGRLLPAARFICMPVPPQDMEETCDDLFTNIFADCDPSLLPGSELEWGGHSASSRAAPNNADELALEVKARVLVAEWFENSLRGYNKMSEKIAQELEDTLITSPGSPTAASGDSSQPQLAEVTYAYYKAKRKDGRTGKSRAPKTCRVLSSRPSDRTVIVQFLENGVRHTIPEDWLVREADKGSAAVEKGGEASAHRARGLLAMALLGSQSSIIQACYEMLLNVLQIGQGILDCKQEQERRSMVQQLQQAWQEEYDMLLQCQSENQEPA
eukprot:s689_g17.t1